MRRFNPLNRWQYGEKQVEERGTGNKFTLTQPKKLFSEDYYSVVRTIAVHNVPADVVPENLFYVYEFSYMVSGCSSCVQFVDEETATKLIIENLEHFLHGCARGQIEAYFNSLPEKEYRVVYNHNGHVIEAGQNRWIPSKEIAKKVLKYQQSCQFFKDTKLYLEERDVENPRHRTACKMYKDKIVYNKDWLYFDALEIGDFVEEDIVRNSIECVPPACTRTDCMQCGEPYSSRQDPKTGKWRTTYTTFSKVTDGIYEYRGHCFLGETEERGEEPVYV